MHLFVAMQKKQKVPESRNSQALCKLENYHCSEAITDTNMDIIADRFMICKYDVCGFKDFEDETKTEKTGCRLYRGNATHINLNG